MSPQTLRADLIAGGFRLTVHAGTLYVDPGNNLTPEQAEAVRQHREELIRLVEADALAAQVGAPTGPKANGPAVWLCRPSPTTGGSDNPDAAIGGRR
jgi:hypothetical protein